MESVPCHHCGRPLRAKRVEPDRLRFCGAGCAVASRVPVDAKGNFPVNAALVSVLAIGFIFFNQLLFWGLAALLAGQGRPEAANLTGIASLGAGAVAALATVRAQWQATGGRAGDVALAGLAGVLLAAGLAIRSPAPAAAGNALLLGWSFRGLLKKKSAHKPDVTV